MCVLNMYETDLKFEICDAWVVDRQQLDITCKGHTQRYWQSSLAQGHLDAKEKGFWGGNNFTWTWNN